MMTMSRAVGATTGLFVVLAAFTIPNSCECYSSSANSQHYSSFASSSSRLGVQQKNNHHQEEKNNRGHAKPSPSIDDSNVPSLIQVTSPLLSSSSTTTEAPFSPIKSKMKKKKKKDVKALNNANEKQKDDNVLIPSVMREQDSVSPMAAFEFQMLEYGFSRLDVLEVTTTIRRVCMGNNKMYYDMIEFLRLTMEYDQVDQQYSEEQDRLIVSKNFIMAAIFHFSGQTPNNHEALLQTKTTYDTPSPKLQILDEEEAYLFPRYSSQQREPRRRTRRRRQRRMELAQEIEQSQIIAQQQQQQQQRQSKIIVFDSDTLVPLVDQVPSHKFTNEDVAQIVDASSRAQQVQRLATSVLDQSRAITQEEATRLTYLLLSVTKDWRALWIRALVVLFHLQQASQQPKHSSTINQSRQEQVQLARQAQKIYAPLAQRLGLGNLKAKLEDTAFQILYKRQYKAARKLFKQENGFSMRVLSSYLKTDVSNILAKDPHLLEHMEDIRVDARVKEPYSAWRKLVRRRFQSWLEPGSSAANSPSSIALPGQVAHDELHDGIALRVVFNSKKLTPEETNEEKRERERFLCYYIQHLIQSHWPLLDQRRAKDYVKSPKPNGYQSLHYTSSVSADNKRWPFEVQIRTHDMHRLAEFGVAAHWDYKAEAASKPLVTVPLPSEDAIVESTKVTRPLAPQVELQTDDTPTVELDSTQEASYIQALKKAQDDLVETNVFVFLVVSLEQSSTRKLLSLPSGARVADAIHELQRTLGDNFKNNSIHVVTTPKIYRKGKQIMQDDDLVQNGDVLLIKIE